MDDEFIATHSLEIMDGRTVIPLDDLPSKTDASPPLGRYIEVIVRYDGQEWTAARGTVEQVDIRHELYERPGSMLDPYGVSEPTGRHEISITLRDVR